MNPPQVYMCSPSRTPLPPPSPYHPSGSSQCTSPKHPVSCIEPGSTAFILPWIKRVSSHTATLGECLFMFKPTTIRYWILFVRSWWHSFWQLIKFHLPVPSSCGIIFTSCEQVETSGVSHYADSKLEIWVQWVCWSGLSRRNGKKKYDGGEKIDCSDVIQGFLHSHKKLWSQNDP